MIIEKNIAGLVILSEESILAALNKINLNRNQIIFCVDENGVLEGALTDGDFRRWVATVEQVDLQRSVGSISNRQVRTASTDDSPDAVKRLLSDGVRFVPIIDARRRVVGVASDNFHAVKIGDFEISDERPTFIVAEIGINHNGSVDLAKRLVDEAAGAGADCAKFQMRNMETLYRNKGAAGGDTEDLGPQYVLDVLSRASLTPEQLFTVFDYCKERAVVPLCTPWDLESVAALEDYGIPGYKVASADLTNHDLLQSVAATGKAVIMSTGMSTELEILESVDVLRRAGAGIVLLHCNSTYPAPFKDVQLNYLDRLRKIAGGPVGYSGHERGYNVAVAAVAKGARVIEKHFTVDRTLQGGDHRMSLLPHEFALMVQGIREVESALGTDESRRVTQGELMNRANLAKSLVAGRDIAVGDVIGLEDIAVRSPGRGLQPNRRSDLAGRTLSRSMRAGDFFYESDIRGQSDGPREFKFSRPWGLPVRYHDYKVLAGASNPDFVEFHLSYKDLDVDFRSYIDKPLDLGLVVHSPDLFPGDHILNLAADDTVYRQRSIAELARVIEVSRRLAPYFKGKPRIVVSVGGFSKDSPLDVSDRPHLYERVAESLASLSTDDVELMPQTLPPFPWYLGGQLHCNLFVGPYDTAAFCRSFGYRVCLDISHSKLAANHLGISFYDFLEAVGTHTGHLHLSDAAGVDGEGLQIGDGEIDFGAIAEQLRRNAPEATFIPEIWQGHANDGEAFWIALDRLERWF